MTADKGSMGTTAGPAKIPLWSFHRPGHSLLAGKTDPRRSPYRRDAGIMAAYAELHRRLGTDQIIWCYTRKDDFRETGIEMVEWAFEVSVTEVMVFCDSTAWARIIGKSGSTLPGGVRRRLMREALERFPNQQAERRAYEAQLFQECWSQPAPSGNWWDHLLVEYTGQEGVDAIIPHPAHREWLVGCQGRGLPPRSPGGSAQLRFRPC